MSAASRLGGSGFSSACLLALTPNKTSFARQARVVIALAPAPGLVSNPARLGGFAGLCPSAKVLYSAVVATYNTASLSLATENMEVKSKTIANFRLHEHDTGSADVQIALLTDRINQLTQHLQQHRKDHSSRRGLLIMVSQRRRLLDYLQSTDSTRYDTVTRKLKLRK
jgi:small subunit ribosomal protein S15